MKRNENERWNMEDGRRKTRSILHLPFSILVFCLALIVLAGCRTETKQKWLTFFFDGVPQPGATNAAATHVVSQTPQISATNTINRSTTPAPAPRLAIVIHPPYAQRECTACHESAYSQKMRGKPGD